MTLAEFFYDLRTAIIIAYCKKYTHSNRIEINSHPDSLDVIIREKTQGLCNCINAQMFNVRPRKFGKHTVLIEEIWVGYDKEGSRWSDNMGGKFVDCSGKNTHDAVDLITDNMMEYIDRVMNG